MKYSVRVDASPRYPIPKTYVVEATSWGRAIKKGVELYFKDNKHMRSDWCKVYATRIKGVLPEE